MQRALFLASADHRSRPDRGCNTVPVTPRPDVVQDSLLESNQPSPIPRPEPRKRGRSARSSCSSIRRWPNARGSCSPSRGDLRWSSSPRLRPPASSRRPRRPCTGRAPRRWLRMAALAALILAAGAASGELLGRRESSPPRSRLEVGAGVRTTTQTGSKPKPAPSDHRSAAPVKKERRPAREVWAANVLGVTAAVGKKGVRLAWKRPQPLRPRGRDANTWLRNEQCRRLPRSCGEVPRCLGAHVQRISLQDRQLRPARTSVDRRSHLSRDAGLYLAARRG